jgi:basic amino acid/polyamine antiporter, APA family
LFMKPAALSYFIIGGALVACVTTVNILFTIIPRSLLVMASEGLLPAFIGKVSARFGTPHWALSVTYGVSLVALLTIPSLRFFASMLNLGLIFAISVACITAAGLPKRNPDLFQKSTIRITAGRLKWVCSIVVAMNSIIFIFLGVAVQFAALVFIALLVGFYLLSFSRRQALQQIRQAQVERSRSNWPA